MFCAGLQVLPMLLFVVFIYALSAKRSGEVFEECIVDGQQGGIACNTGTSSQVIHLPVVSVGRLRVCILMIALMERCLYKQDQVMFGDWRGSQNVVDRSVCC